MPAPLIRVGKVVSIDALGQVSGGPTLTITVDSWLSDLHSAGLASDLFVSSNVDDVSDAAGPGRMCMVRLLPMGVEPEREIAGRYVRFKQWKMAAFGGGSSGGYETRVFGTPAVGSAFTNLTAASAAGALVGSAVYIRRPEHEVQRPW